MLRLGSEALVVLLLLGSHAYRFVQNQGTTGGQDFALPPAIQLQASKNPSGQLPFTASNGAPYATQEDSKGRYLFEPEQLYDLLGHFVRERIPERIVHAKGSGAHGTFTCTTDYAKQFTSMDLFSEVGKKTPITARFSTVGGETGSPDEARDPRGFSVKFRTRAGIWDLVMNNTPVFFIRDAVKFPVFIHTQKRNPETNLKDPVVFWDYLGSNPEALLQFLRLFSDLGTPIGFTQMDGWTGHAYRWVKKDGSWVYVKLYAKTNQGVGNFTASEAEKVASQNPDFATEDLRLRIESGKFPSWTLFAQVLSPAEAEKFRYNIFDLTKDWPHDMLTPHEIGKFELNQNPLNFFAEVEQASFAPSNTVEGWKASEDPVLKQRMISYSDASRYRLGVNFDQIPVNCPLNPVSNFDRDGHAAVLGNQGSQSNYYPNLRSLGLENAGYDDNHLAFIRKSILSMNEISDIDFEQPQKFWNDLSEKDKANLISNIAGHLGKVSVSEVISKVLSVLSKASNDLSQGVKAEMQKK